MKVAFVHEWLTSYGGAERVLESMLELFPGAPVFTLVHVPQALRHSTLSKADIRVSPLSRLPFAGSKYRAYLPLMPLAVEQFDLRGHDLVLSFSHSLSHGVLLQPGQLHICYMYTPARFAWHQYQDYLAVHGLRSGVRGVLAKWILHYFRMWDQLAVGRVDHLLAISESTARAAWRAYRRPAQVIYPPVDLDRFRPLTPRGDYYVTLARLVPNKHVDLIVQACAALGRRLLVIGDGPERKRLERLAGNDVQLLGWLPDDQVGDLLGRARAFVHAAEEDFGIAPVEAMAAGCPIIAYADGGLQESVTDGLSGLFFEERSVSGVMGGLQRFESIEAVFRPQAVRQAALPYGKDRFQTEMLAFIQGAWQAFEGS